MPQNIGALIFGADMTTVDKAALLQALKERRANQPDHINNSSLVAGSPMTYYCRSCGHVAEVLPEDHLNRPRRLCDDCQTLRDLGWLDMVVL